jgi:hypothetical protein
VREGSFRAAHTTTLSRSPILAETASIRLHCVAGLS